MERLAIKNVYLRKDQREFSSQKSKILTSLLKMYLALKLFYSIMESILSIICSNFFSNYKVDQMKTKASANVPPCICPCILDAFIVSRLFEEKRRDVVFGFRWCVVRGAWCVVPDF